jgi:hypothetical protein
MTACAPRSGPLQAAIAAIPSCALDETGRREQRDRYARLAQTVSRLERRADAIEIEFDEDLDHGTLERTLAVERECCPFFVFALDEASRRLRVTVDAPEHAPALDAVAGALRSARRAGSPGRPEHGTASRGSSAT